MELLSSVLSAIVMTKDARAGIVAKLLLVESDGGISAGFVWQHGEFNPICCLANH